MATQRPLPEDIVEILHDIAALSGKANAIAARITTLHRSIVGDVAAPAVTISPVTTPAVQVPAPIVVPASPAAWPGPDTPEIRALIAQSATAAGLDAGAFEAIERHESANYTSKLFLTGRPAHGDDPGEAPAWNPGGIKAGKVATSLGAIQPDYVSSPDSGRLRYARFVDGRHGIVAHAGFLMQSRYDAARRTSDPFAQLDAIGAAGYAEGDPGWIAGTKAHLREIQARGDVKVSSAPVSASSVREAALALVGHPSGDNDPIFHYAAGTEGGNLGCANAVSTALIHAGVLKPSQMELSVDGLDQRLQGMGWTVQHDPAEGDVAILAPTANSNGHKHTGIFVSESGVLYLVNNHSSGRVVKKDLWATFGRPLEHVLRASGA